MPKPQDVQWQIIIRNSFKVMSARHVPKIHKYLEPLGHAKTSAMQVCYKGGNILKNKILNIAPCKQHNNQKAHKQRNPMRNYKKKSKVSRNKSWFLSKHIKLAFNLFKTICKFVYNWLSTVFQFVFNWLWTVFVNYLVSLFMKWFHCF